METALFLARIIGIVYTALGIGLLLSGNYYREVMEKLLDNAAYMFLGGFIAVVVGFLIIEHHNIWANDWTVIITLIGWAALIKGVLILVIPRSFQVFKGMLRGKMLVYVITPAVLLFGLIFLYFGFFS
jgi:hypothetical protein